MTSSKHDKLKWVCVCVCVRVSVSAVISAEDNLICKWAKPWATPSSLIFMFCSNETAAVTMTTNWSASWNSTDVNEVVLYVLRYCSTVSWSTTAVLTTLSTVTAEAVVVILVKQSRLFTSTEWCAIDSRWLETQNVYFKCNAHEVHIVIIFSHKWVSRIHVVTLLVSLLISC